MSLTNLDDRHAVRPFRAAMSAALSTHRHRAARRRRIPVGAHRIRDGAGVVLVGGYRYRPAALALARCCLRPQPPRPRWWRRALTRLRPPAGDAGVSGSTLPHPFLSLRALRNETAGALSPRQVPGGGGEGGPCSAGAAFPRFGLSQMRSERLYSRVRCGASAMTGGQTCLPPSGSRWTGRRRQD